MTLLDNFTVRYVNKRVENETVKQLMSLQGPSFNSPHLGTFNVCLYTYQGSSPRILVSLVMFGEESLESFTNEGIEFGKIKRMTQFRLFDGNSEAAVIDATLVDDEFVILQIGPRDLICLAPYEKIKSFSREQLAKLLVEEYFRRFYDYEAEYSVQIQDNSILEP
ncbi:hypothetical protein [Thermotoga caldifontis]|uniref:hypothetical protein n=1 Tax=Thermotoga caldifontis TaxID=1508419 RepID=UPI000596D767|nr:hypothetical protein [Thermotoga caldifontis]